MNEELELMPFIVLAGLLTVFGLDIERRRAKLRSIFNTFDKEESEIAELLERMVFSGELQPYATPVKT